MGDLTIPPLWAVAQDIERIIVCDNERECEAYRVGHQGVSRIEKTERPGEYCMIPYVRVWRGNEAVAEFGQHKLVGLYYFPSPPETPNG